MGIVDKLKKSVSNTAIGQKFIELFEEKNDDLPVFLYETYKDASDNIEKYRAEWEANKKAYMTKPIDQAEGNSSIVDDDGNVNLYCSSIVPDKIEDVVAIQLGGRPTVYPLPHINRQFNYLQFGLQDSPEFFVRDLWTSSFKDLQERRGMQEINTKISLNARLFGFSPVKIYQAYDFDTRQQDIFIDVIEPKDFLFDPEAKTLQDCSYIFTKKWKMPFEVITKYPKMREEILSCIGGDSDLNYIKTDYNEREKNKNKICIVETYIRDLTVIEETNQDKNDFASYLTQDKGPNYKYPSGRRIVFIEKTKGIIILEDEANPYKTFPFAIFVPKPISWCMIGRNEATPLRALQIADDFTIQQMLSNLRKLGNGVLLYDRKGLADPEAIKMKVGEAIPVDFTGAVQFSISKGITADSSNVHGMILTAARDISGVEAAAEGRAPGSITSGVGISILQEATNRKVKGSSDIYAEFLTNVWKQVGDIMIDVYTTGRALRVSDSDGIPVELPVSLGEVTDSIDVIVDSFTQLAQDPVSMANLMLSLGQLKDANGTPFVTRELIASVLKIPGFREAAKQMDEQMKQMSQQKMDISQMQAQAGMQPQGAEAPQPNAVNGPDSAYLGNMDPSVMMNGLSAGQPGLNSLTPEQLSMISG